MIINFQLPYISMMGILTLCRTRQQLLCLLLFSPCLYGVENLSFDIANIKSHGWQLTNASIALANINEPTQQLALSVEKLSLPDPFAHFSFVDIQCFSFSWNDNGISCNKGQAKFKPDLVNRQTFDFSFSVSDKKSQLTLQHRHFAKGKVSIVAKEQQGDWLIKIEATKLHVKPLQSLLLAMGIKNTLEEISSGVINVQIELTGTSKTLRAINFQSQISDLTIQTQQGRVATSQLAVGLDLSAKLKQGAWLWQNRNVIHQGEIYYEPVFIEVSDDAIQLNASGVLHADGNITIKDSHFIHDNLFELSFVGQIKPSVNYQIDNARVLWDVSDLEQFSGLYLSAFFEQTPFEGVLFKGKGHAAIDIKQSIITQVYSTLENFYLSDDKNRFMVGNAKAKINWSNNSTQISPSTIQWDRLKIKAIPINKGELKFQALNHSIHLLEPSSLPILGGALHIKQFEWQKQADNEPDVYFQGSVKDVSLEQLSTALNWTPLSGKITGTIPAVEYKNKTLSLNGGLSINVFDGEVKIEHLTSSGLFTDFPKLTMDMTIENLDLDKLTQKFQMGGIEGRASGFIQDLYLENWQPVTFYAWLGTPENDDSAHRISQKAVQNIASIGGGGAADVISKGFLRFFDTFGYDKLGFGCYLYKGTCQLMGVEAATQGYYLIKGGGLPRIDVIGYNPRVDWHVLLQRLARVVEMDEVIVE